MATGSGGSSSGKAGDVRAGGAYFEFWGKDKITGVLEGLKKKALAVGKFMTQLGSTSLKAGLALSIPAIALLTKGVGRAAEVDRLAEAWGMSVEQMSRFSYAAEVAGVALDEVIANQSKYQDLINRAPVIDTATAKAATQSTREFRSAIIALQDAMTPLIRELAPIFTAIGSFARQNAKLVQILGIAGVALIAFGAISMTLGTVLTGLTAAVSGLVAVMGALLVPALKVALIGALAYGLFKLLKQFELGRQLISDVGNALNNLREIGRRALADLGQAFGLMLGGVMDAFRAGDLRLAGEIAMKGLEVAWKRTVLAMTEVWVDFKGSFVDGWHMIVAGFAIAFRSLLPIVKQELIHIASAIVHALLTAIDQVLLAGQAAARQLPVGGETIAAELEAARQAIHRIAQGAQNYAEFELRSASRAIERVSREEIAALMEILGANAKFRDNQVAAARQEFEQALAELQALRLEAAAAAAAQQPAAGRGPRFREPLYIPRPEELQRSVRASFALISGRQQFGAGDNLTIPKATLKETQQIGRTLLLMLRHTAKLDLIADGIESLGFGFE